MTAEEENRLLEKENSRLQMELDFLKSRSGLCGRVKVKFTFITESKDSFSMI